MWKNTRILEYTIAILVSGFCCILYVKTLCPTTDFIDSGELSTAAYTLGIAHPTGYPIFTLIGWLFSHLPLPGTVVYRLNLMAAVLCSIGLFFFFRVLLLFTREIIQFSRSQRGFIEFIPAMFGTIALGMSETFWAQATGVEVYSLHAVFLSVLLLLFTRAVVTGRERGKKNIPASSIGWYAFAFVLGLAFTNHMTTILLAPGFLFLYFYTFKFDKGTWNHLAGLIPAFLLGFSAYLYLPIRASTHPLLNWGNPVDLEKFWWHFTGKQYRVWIFSSSESAMKQLNYFCTTITPKFAYLPVVLAVLGLWRLLRTHWSIFLYTLLLLLGCVFYAINYDIHDIDSYFLLAFYILALWSAMGCAEILDRLKTYRTRVFVGSAGLLLLIGVMSVNYDDVDESKSYMVEDYTRNMFNSVENNAILISYQWDYFVSAAYYYQIVEGVRPDVVVIDKELLRRSWYYKQMQHRYPWLYESSKSEIEAFLVELYKFEHNEVYNPNLIEMRYQKVIQSFISKNYQNRPIYATGEIEESYTSGYRRVPNGLAFRLYMDTLYHQIKEPEYLFRPSSQNNQYTNGIRLQYARSYVNCSIYMHLRGNDTTALQLTDKALEMQQGMPEALSLKESILRKRIP